MITSQDALTRARMMYFARIGHYALGLKESEAVRLAHPRSHLVTFAGREPAAEEIADFTAIVLRWKASRV